MKPLIFLSLFVSYSAVCFAQTICVKNIKGRAYITGDVSPNTARKQAIDDARINALKSAGIPEKIYSEQVLNTGQDNNQLSQSFQSGIHSLIAGMVKYDSVTSEKISIDSASRVLYEVTINATIEPYSGNTPTQNTPTPNTPPSTEPGTNDNTVHVVTHNYPNGDIFTGYVCNGLRNGYGTYTWANGDQYSGFYKDGKRSGSGIMYCASGRILKGEWVGGVYVGQDNNYAGAYKYYHPVNATNQYAGNSYPNHTVSNYSNPTGSYYANPIQHKNATALSPEDKLSDDEENFNKEIDQEQAKQ